MNSKAILKELTNNCNNIPLTAASQLAKGGISLYFNTKENRDKALEKLTEAEEPFGGGKKKLLFEHKCIPVFLKGIDTGVETSVIEGIVEEKVGKEVQCNRLYNNNTGRPIQVIKLLCPRDCC